MRLYARLLRYWPTLLATALALGALALLWRVRDSALDLGAIGHIDALGAFFAFALFGGSALMPRAAAPARCWRMAAAAIVLALAYSTALIPVIVAGYLLFALLTLELDHISAPASGPVALRQRAISLLQRATKAAPGLLAAACLLVGYGALALRGAIRYDDRTAGAALDSFVFWFVLLAAVIPLAPLARSENKEQRTKNKEQRTKNREPRTGEPENRRTGEPENRRTAEAENRRAQFSIFNFQFSIFNFVWLYPLVRLYSLGPWNNGWSFAALLLGGALALWCASAALAQPEAIERSTRIATLYLALALAGFGLGTSAGIAAGCFGILTYLVLVSGQGDRETGRQGDRETEDRHTNLQSAICNLQSAICNLPWLLSSALPFTAPFVAAWMLMGALVAGGVALLAGVTWLAALLHALTVALWDAPDAANERRPRQLAGLLSIVLGVGAPLIVRWPLQSIVAQLQGGLTPYGDINIWPWVGLATSDAAHTQVTTLPSIAIALLMLVLSALVYLVARLRESRNRDRPLSDDQDAAAQAPVIAGGAAADVAAILHSLRDEVPWLGGLLGSIPRDQRRPGDDE